MTTEKDFFQFGTKLSLLISAQSCSSLSLSASAGHPSKQAGGGPGCKQNLINET